MNRLKRLPEIFNSRQLTSENKTYTFDVKEHNEQYSLYITQTTETENGNEISRLIVPEKSIDDFSSAFVAAICSIKGNSSSEAKDDHTDENETEIKTKAYDLEEIRKEQSNAYRPWTKADDIRLEEQFKVNANITRLAKVFKHNEGAIRSRLDKLGLMSRE